MATSMVASRGTRLAVFQDGPSGAPPIVMVHGYPDTHTVWDRVAGRLATDHRVIRYDVRGAGASGRPRGLRAYRLDRLADDLFAVIDTVSPGRKVHVVAHDWGSIQCWEAVTDPRAPNRIAGFTSISGPCLDHLGLWFRHRLSRPHRAGAPQAAYRARNSWYIYAFHVPLLAPLVWRLGLARRWPSVLARLEGIEADPAPTLARDAIAGIRLYRANMIPRLVRPRRRPARIPVQLITLARDRYVSPAFAADLDRWVADLRRDSVDAGHWEALSRHDERVAMLIRRFGGELES